MRYTNLVRERFESLRVIKELSDSRPKRLLCKCDCGKTHVMLRDNWKLTKSCGCSKNGNPTHGLSGTFEHRVWKQIWRRCRNPNDIGYSYYGGRGIKVCKRWRKFENFFRDMGLAPSPTGYSIERKNSNGNYEPGNCIWLLRTLQNRNRRDTVRMTFKGETKSMIEWCEALGLNYSAVRCRYNRGCSVERCLVKGRLKKGGYKRRTKAEMIADGDA